MISLTDQQLDVDRRQRHRAVARGVFLERCAAMLKLRGRFDDTDVAEVTTLALQGLVQQAADTAA